MLKRESILYKVPCHFSHRYIQDCEIEISRVPSAFSWPGVSVFHPFFSMEVAPGYK